MAATESTMQPLGTRAPAFTLLNPQGVAVSSESIWKEYPNGLVVVFMCNHCPFVIHLREALAAFGREAMEHGVGVVGINSNDVEHYPADHPDKMASEIEAAGYSFPYLYDETQEVAKAYGAACTPDFYLFDADQTLVYRGQFDDSRPNTDAPITGDDLRHALQAMLDGAPIPTPQRPSLGCNIKWKAGNAPAYFGANA